MMESMRTMVNVSRGGIVWFNLWETIKRCVLKNRKRVECGTKNSHKNYHGTWGDGNPLLFFLFYFYTRLADEGKRLDREIILKTSDISQSVSDKVVHRILRSIALWIRIDGGVGWEMWIVLVDPVYSRQRFNCKRNSFPNTLEHTTNKPRLDLIIIYLHFQSNLGMAINNCAFTFSAYALRLFKFVFRFRNWQLQGFWFWQGVQGPTISSLCQYRFCRSFQPSRTVKVVAW